jgi:hypothetical protein
MVAVGFAIRIPHISRSALACYGVLPYAPDLQEEVVKTVLAQAELLRAEWGWECRVISDQ